MLWPVVLTALAAASGQPLRVAMFDGPGVARKGFLVAREILRADPRVELQIVAAAEIRTGVLDDMDVVVFMGGDGAKQGRSLGAGGRERVREFVRAGGGYLGVCAGAYLAMQGPDTFKLRLVAAQNLSKTSWKRGVAAAAIEAVGGDDELQLHFANGPVFAPAPADDLPAYVPVARFVSDHHRREHGTRPGEMPGTPAILVSAFGRGRVLLFSPHPALDRPGKPRPELLTRGVRWLAKSGDVSTAVTFTDVFSD